MSLIKWNKKEDFFPSLTSFFDDFLGFDFVGGVQTGTTVPAVNITEAKDQFEIEVAAPGLKKEDFKINLDNGMLTISTETKEEKEITEKKVTRKEFSFSKFQRSFTLPETVQTDNINAGYNNGVLTIKLPKKEELKKEPIKQIVIS